MQANSYIKEKNCLVVTLTLLNGLPQVQDRSSTGCKEDGEDEHIFFTLMARGPDVDMSEITGKEQLEAQPAKKGRGRKPELDLEMETLLIFLIHTFYGVWIKLTTVQVELCIPFASMNLDKISGKQSGREVGHISDFGIAPVQDVECRPTEVDCYTILHLNHLIIEAWHWSNCRPLGKHLLQTFTPLPTTACSLYNSATMWSISMRLGIYPSLPPTLCSY
ncbi:Signal recognition particle 9 kDa protein [Hibiscus syriacus]|uniref:Signal recognition particle 9 kDa protein n=1 Tax=Hibiscus syriacus TaxID=106335 RepID=A0A6A2Y0W5_HIBSY|nr:Signal recognition particle 9 kDa protein [Hibiscus syriacus]